ncbi:hypothetical protein KHC19_10630 [Ancylobacter oerskovii]|nr:hypothetical protein [Ancylobacter oerskovii]
MSTVAATLDVARSHLAARLAQRTAGRSPQRRGRPPLPEEALLAAIEAVIADMPTYGYARHDGRIAVARSNLRWCSDGFEIGCDNDEKVRVAFALDCCDREAIGPVATTEGIEGEDVCDLMVTASSTASAGSTACRRPSNG